MCECVFQQDVGAQIECAHYVLLRCALGVSVCRYVSTGLFQCVYACVCVCKCVCMAVCVCACVPNHAHECVRVL